MLTNHDKNISLDTELLNIFNMMYLLNWIFLAPVIFSILIMLLSIFFYRNRDNIIISSIFSAVSIPVLVFYFSAYGHADKLILVVTALQLTSAFFVTSIRCHYCKPFALDVSFIVSIMIGFASAVLGVRYILFDPSCDIIYKNNIPTAVVLGIISFLIVTVISIIVTAFVYLTINRVEDKEIDLYYKFSYLSFFTLSFAQLALIFF